TTLFRSIARGTMAKSALERATASRSSECHFVPTPLMRIATGIGQTSQTASTAALRAAVLSSDFTASSRSRTTRSAPALRALSIARGFDAGRKSKDRMANRSLPPSFLASASIMAVASCPEQGRLEKSDADYIHDRRRGPRVFLRDDGREDRPPGLSLHDRAFRTVRPRRRTRVQLRHSLLLSRRPSNQHDGAGS